MKLIQVKFPSLGHMVVFVRNNKPIINSYEPHTDTLIVEDNEVNRTGLKSNNGEVVKEFAETES